MAQINKSSEYFNTVLYTGTGATQSITGVGFQPDWRWGKGRTLAGYNHGLADSVRGVSKLIYSNLIAEENLIEVIQDKPLGLGHAIWCAKDYISGPFAVILPDDLVLSDVPCIGQMIEVSKKSKSNVVAIQGVDKNNIEKYGVIDYYKNENNIYHVKGMVEKPAKEKAPSNLAIIGRYILNPSIIEELSNHELGVGGEIQLTDAIKKLINSESVIGYKFEGNRYDCGNIMGALEAQLSLAIKDEKYKSQVKEMINNLYKD